MVWDGGGFKTETREGTVENSPWKNGANASQGGGWDAGPLKQREQVGFKTENWGQKRKRVLTGDRHSSPLALLLFLLHTTVRRYLKHCTRCRMSNVMIDTYAEYIRIHIGLPNVWCLVSHLLIYILHVQLALRVMTSQYSCSYC